MGRAMSTTADAFSLGWDQLACGIAAVGALGLAAFGLTEALGKALAYRSPHGAVHFGLPYAGLHAVKAAVEPLGPALRLAYGSEWLDIVAQHYRAGRSKGAAPDTIRQGVRLALPFMDAAAAGELIGTVWDMGQDRSAQLAQALQAQDAPSEVLTSPSGPIDPMQALAGRFATALDARINAAFSLAEERYEAQAKMWAGVAAVGLSLVLNYGLGAAKPGHADLPWAVALVIGFVAVPLAPVAKDISSKLQDALTAFKSIPARRG